MNNDVFAQNLHAFRTAREITQTEIAKRLFVTPQTVSKWEKGLALPDVENLCNLAEVLQTTPDRLLGIEQRGERVFVGIDAGGTKTDAVLFRADGTVLRRKIFPGANPNAYGMERALETLGRAVEELCEGLVPCGIFAGVAGSTAADNRKKMIRAMKSRFFGVPLSVDSDIENVISSVRGMEHCAAVICGTGNVVFAREGDVLKRIGGYGYLFDGAGSGYDIGRDVLSACLEADDGLRSHSILTDLATKQLGGKAWDKLNTLYEGGKDTIASFAPIAFEAARRGDPVAEEILQKNFARIGRLIRCAREKYGCPEKVIFAGSIAKTEEFQSAVKDFGITPVLPDKPPVYGACVKCATLYAYGVSDEFEENFIRTFPN